MAIAPKLTPLQQTEANRLAKAAEKPKREFSEAEKTLRKDRVAKAKDALARSVGSRSCGPEELPAEAERAQAARRRTVRDAARRPVHGSAEEEDQRPSILTSWSGASVRLSCSRRGNR